MIKIVCSLCAKRRIEYLTNRLKFAASAVLVVPEQFLFETERSMYQLLGARKIAVTEITGLSKLAADVIKSHGEPKLYADEIVKAMTMYKTLRRLRGHADYDSSRRMLDIIADMKSAAIAADFLADSLTEVEDEALLCKLTEISEVYSAYTATLDADFADKLDDCRNAADLINRHNCYAGKQVFLYEFDGFSAGQIGLLKAIAESADSVEILFRTDTKSSEFKTINRLISRLSHEAAELGGESNTPAVELWTADNVVDEARFVAGEIRRLITREGYILNEIAVLTCDSSNTGRLKEAMAEYEISCYADLPEPILTKSMTRFIIAALNAVKLETPALLSYIRSGFVRVMREGESRRLSLIDMDLLERNAFRFALNAKEWRSAFPESNRHLREIEPLRAEVVQPLIDLRKACENKSGDKITELLCEFLLETMQLQKTVLGFCDGDVELSAEFRQLWDLTIEVFESLHAALKGEMLELDEYAELLRGVFSSVNIAKPPQVLDAAVIGDLARSRMSGVKVAFVIGANAGRFPKSAAAANAVFSSREIESLADCGLEIDARLEERYDFERLMVNKAMTLPTERLYISAPLSNAAWEELTVSAMFEESGLPVNNYSYTDSTDRKVSVPGAACPAVHILTPETAVKLFSTERFSPTAIETMMGCRFRYFCRYGLSIDIPVAENEEEPIALERGNLIHYCLERALREPNLPADLEKFVAECIHEYRETKLPAGFAQTKRQSYILSSFKTGIVRMIHHIRRDFEDCGFKPINFEKKMDFLFGNTRLTGKIDRIDKNGDLVRVIDYKSGTKEMNFESVFYGLDMQMLLYLYAVTGEGVKPDSALYLPSDGVRVKEILTPGASHAERLKNWTSAHAPSGISVGASEANSRRVRSLTAGEYERLKNYCGRLIDTKVAQVKRGNIEAIAAETACKYCEFSAVCGKQRVKTINKQLIERVIHER
jgi:ATP-dependent helicase/nuclease subunit B